MSNKKNKRKVYRKKRYKVPIMILAALIIQGLLLPFILKGYVNNVLEDIPGYYGQVYDIDVSLISRAYGIDSLYLDKRNAGSQVPFLKAPKTDISIEWNALLNGKIVSEVIMAGPEILYVFEDQSNTVGNPDLDDRTKALTDLVLIAINHLKINDGKAAFVEVTADPAIDLYLNSVQLNATNLRNVAQKERTFPSEVHATATSIGQGQLQLDGKMNLVKKIPDMDISVSLENSDIAEMNDFTNHYAGIDFAEGNFHLYRELAIADGFLTGYIKPILEDSKLIEKEDKFFEKLWEGYVGFFKFILKNQKNNSLATKVPLEGDLNKLGGKGLPTVLNIFKNG